MICACIIPASKPHLDINESSFVTRLLELRPQPLHEYNAIQLKMVMILAKKSLRLYMYEVGLN
jgi:hypothetical protein